MRNGYQVYVVGGDPRIGRAIRFFLATLKLGCRRFSSGADFLEELDRLTPGCVLADCNMAGLRAEIERRGVNWPIIIMADEADLPAVARAVREGAVDFIVRPIRDEALLGALHKGFVRLKRAETAATPAAARR